MPGPTLTVDELAEELGRKSSYVYQHWRALAEKKMIPPPLNGGGAPLTWSRAQLYALLDKDLPREQRIAAQAYRAAAAAAAGAHHTAKSELEDAEWGARLNNRFAARETM